MKELNNIYHSALYDIGGSEFRDIDISSDKLGNKLTQYCKHLIKIHNGNTKRGNIIYSSSLNEADAFRNEISFEQTNISNKVREVAFIRRKEIMEAEKTDLPQNLQLEDLMSGEVQIPDILLQFMTLLITGPHKPQGYTPSKQRCFYAFYALWCMDLMEG